MTARPALDAWLAEADALVRGGDDYLADGMRCRPAGECEPTEHLSFEIDFGPVIEFARSFAVQFSEAMTALNDALVSAGWSVSELAEEVERISRENEAERNRIRDELDRAYSRRLPSLTIDSLPALKFPNLPALPIPTDICPRHGRTIGGSCFKCRR